MIKRIGTVYMCLFSFTLGIGENPYKALSEVEMLEKFAGGRKCSE